MRAKLYLRAVYTETREIQYLIYIAIKEREMQSHGIDCSISSQIFKYWTLINLKLILNQFWNFNPAKKIVKWRYLLSNYNVQIRIRAWPVQRHGGQLTRAPIWEVATIGIIIIFVKACQIVKICQNFYIFKYLGRGACLFFSVLPYVPECFRKAYICTSKAHINPYISIQKIMYPIIS